jgi:DNA modification methylase
MNTIKKRRNPHPTLKPISLARYLATLLLPPAMYAPRRIFVPFAGVASECIGAHQALWEEIVGIEMDEQYCQIAKMRAEYWQKKGIQLEMFQ